MGKQDPYGTLVVIVPLNDFITHHNIDPRLCVDLGDTFPDWLL